MHPVIEQLHDSKIPTTCFLAAIQQINYQGVQSLEYYNKKLTSFIGKKVSIPNLHLARFTFLYFIQESIRSYNDTGDINVSSVRSIAEKKAEIFLKNNPWIMAQREETVKIDAATGAPKRKKGAKQEMAAKLYKEHKGKAKKEIISIFVNEIGMTPAGAQTYYYNMKKKFGKS